MKKDLYLMYLGINRLAEIRIEEGIKDESKMPIVYIPLKFALMLQPGDILIFPSEDEPKPKWISVVENYDQLIDMAVIIIDRIITRNRLYFMAKCE